LARAFGVLLPSYSANLPERTRNRSRLASNIPHDTLFAPRGVLGRKTSTYRTKCWSRPNIRKGSAMAHKSSASSDTGEAIAADTPETREEMASKLVDRFALWSGVAGLIPVPVVDVFAVGGLQIQMVRRLSQIYDVEFSENRGKALIASLAGSMIPATSGIGAASVLKAVPIIGTIAGGFVMPALSAGASYAIGKAFIQHFATGGTLLDFNPPDYREFIKRQRDMWDSRKNRAAKSAQESGATTTSP
jgi:uncharacterized protein (DUF697 family)